MGPRHTQISAEEQYWQRGGAVFTFVDSQGQQGPKNRQYLAWQLPNSYQAPHQKRSKGRQKKINQQLVSLVNQGVQGTDQQRVDKLFWPNGAAAGKAYNKDQELDSYWPRGKAQQTTRCALVCSDREGRNSTMLGRKKFAGIIGVKVKISVTARQPTAFDSICQASELGVLLEAPCSQGALLDKG